MPEYSDNGLLRVFRPAWIALLEPLEPVTLCPRQVLYKMDERVEHIYFPVRVIGATVRPMPDGKRVPYMTAPAAVFGTHTLLQPEALFDLEIVVGDTKPNAWRVPRVSLLLAMQQNAALDRGLRGFIHVMWHFLMLAGACRGTHDAEPRFCKTLLLIRDGLGTSHIPLSVPTLAELLSVDRKYLTAVVNKMVECGLLTRRTRHSLGLLNTAAIERRACSCYRYLA